MERHRTPRINPELWTAIRSVLVTRISNKYVHRLCTCMMEHVRKWDAVHSSYTVSICPCWLWRQPITCCRQSQNSRSSDSSRMSMLTKQSSEHVLCWNVLPKKCILSIPYDWVWYEEKSTCTYKRVHCVPWLWPLWLKILKTFNFAVRRVFVRMVFCRPPFFLFWRTDTRPPTRIVVGLLSIVYSNILILRILSQVCPLVFASLLKKNWLRNRV